MALAFEIGLLTEEENPATLYNPELAKKINAAYKEYIGKLVVKVGFLLIVSSGINAFVKSCQSL